MKGVRAFAADVRVPLGHCHHAADAGFSDGRRRAERVAVEGVEPGIAADFAQGAHQQRQVVAPIAGEHRLRAAGLDLGRAGQEVAHLALRMQLVADDLHVGPSGLDHRARLLQHVLAEAVVLADEEQALHGAVVAQHVGQRRQPHVGVGVKAGVPEDAALVAQRRVHRRVVEEQRAPLRFTVVVLVQRATQLGQRFFGAALAVQALQRQRPHGAAHAHAAAAVDAFGGQQQVAEHGFAGVAEGARQSFEEGQADRPRGRLRHQPWRDQAHRQRQAGASFSIHVKWGRLERATAERICSAWVLQGCGNGFLIVGVHHVPRAIQP